MDEEENLIEVPWAGVREFSRLSENFRGTPRGFEKVRG